VDVLYKNGRERSKGWSASTAVDYDQLQLLFEHGERGESCEFECVLQWVPVAAAKWKARWPNTVQGLMNRIRTVICRILQRPEEQARLKLGGEKMSAAGHHSALTHTQQHILLPRPQRHTQPSTCLPLTACRKNRSKGPVKPSDLLRGVLD